MNTFSAEAAKQEEGTEQKSVPRLQREEASGNNPCDLFGSVISSTREQESPALTEQKPFTCPQLLCAKTFTSKYKLCRHMATHSMQKPHQCVHCGKMFHRKDHLRNHLQTHNPNKEALQCSECSKNYSTKHGHRRHLALHAAASGDLCCKVCLQVFGDSQAVLEHLKSHFRKTPGGSKEKKYSCEHCDRRFYTRKDVRRHLVVHTGRKDFQCHCCSQRFGRKDHLTRHMKKSHCEEPPRIKVEPPDMLGHLSCSAIVKEEFSPLMCMQPRDIMSVGMYSAPYQPMSNTGISHSFVPSSLSVGLSYPHECASTISTAPPPLPTSIYQLTTTSYLPKGEMEGFFSEGSGSLSISSAELSSSPPQPQLDETFLSTMCDPLSAAGMDFSHFLGFLPLGFPPCNMPVSTAGLVKGFSQGEAQQLLTTLNHTQLQDCSGPGGSLPLGPLHSNPVFTSNISNGTLPRFHQAFQ
ncbi:hypothetical protein FKM82_007702 [Ascaphus truei]